MSTQLARIAAKARADTRVCFTSLAHVMTEEFLAETWTKLNRKGAAGVDRETIETYALNLDERLRDLHQRLKQGRYRAPPVRAVEIPKSNGKVRMLGIPTVEDRLVQAAVARLLNAVFEPVFLDCSYGFRPGKSAHQALKTLREQIVCKPVMQVYEADIRAFFDRVSHTWLRRMLRQRVADKTLLRLIDKWLQAGVMREGLVSERGEGVPQGGPVSPILSNIYLHYALDLWFEKKVKPAMRGHAAIIRFADDFVACFQYASDVKRFETVLPRRLEKFEIAIAPEKTRRLLFGRFAAERLAALGRKPQEFVFLGFRHICGLGQDGRFALIRLPANDRLRRFRASAKLWLRQHNHWKVRDQQQKLSQMLQGFYAYYGITHCTGKLAGVHHYVVYMWRKTLLRRSQRAKRKAHWSILKKKSWFVLPTPLRVHNWV